MTDRPADGVPGAPARDPFTALPDDFVPPAAPVDAEAAPGAASEAVNTGTPQTAEAGDATKEWWDDPNLPWKHKPSRSDIACMGWIAFMGAFGLAMLPLRSWLLGLNPWLLVTLTGSRSGTAALGALARVGQSPHWWLALLFGTIMSIKFDWVFWWAGKLWGRGMIEVWAGRSARAKRNYARAERWAAKFGWIGMFLAYVPIPLPLMQVIFVLAGAEGWSWKKFMALDALASTVWLLAYFALGWAIGAPAVDVLKAYAKIAQYVAIALVVVIVGSTFWRGRRPNAA